MELLDELENTLLIYENEFKTITNEFEDYDYLIKKKQNTANCTIQDISQRLNCSENYCVADLDNLKNVFTRVVSEYTSLNDDFQMLKQDSRNETFYSNIRGLSLESNIDNDDNESETSGISTSSKCLKFYLKIRNDKNNLLCNGCRNPIKCKYFLSFSSLHYHTLKKCLMKVYPPYKLKDSICYIKISIDCSKTILGQLSGIFKMENIIKQGPQRQGNTARNQMNKGFIANPLKKNDKQTVKRQNHIPNKGFITNPNKEIDVKTFETENLTITPTYYLNKESFLFNRIKVSEKCAGCGIVIGKNCHALKHKEQIPRDARLFNDTDEIPFVSQYYHCDPTVNMNDTVSCLLKRGFTKGYLSTIKCHAIVSEDDNFGKVKTTLSNCGFRNINCERKERPFTGLCVNQPSKPNENPHFHLTKLSSNENVVCKGCDIPIKLNDKCVYYFKPPCQMSSLVYHLKTRCLIRKEAFTDIQLRQTLCLIDPSTNMDPTSLIECGFLNFKEGNFDTRRVESSNTTAVNKYKWRSRERNSNAN